MIFHPGRPRRVATINRQLQFAVIPLSRNGIEGDRNRPRRKYGCLLPARFARLVAATATTATTAAAAAAAPRPAALRLGMRFIHLQGASV